MQSWDFHRRKNLGIFFCSCTPLFEVAHSIAARFVRELKCLASQISGSRGCIVMSHSKKRLIVRYIIMN
ncbi:hypothetical protein NSE_0338 [Neorickettsia sennetsu str. Miyayama]|uniref:Uncharacterized protein n=1 Tax=Ehrlichia sennetsu (strain ATCC VR-367 / Miyayama) TaxID=222891 RepID=Q2GE69_EHRS3|nr:hypothetical protein NSE_0338 [Neorickettsia sennetsu str. Miyayama]